MYGGDGMAATMSFESPEYLTNVASTSGVHLPLPSAITFDALTYAIRKRRITSGRDFSVRAEAPKYAS